VSVGKEKRVRKRVDFLRVQRDGRAVRTPHFVMLVAVRLPQGPTRLGIVATKKTGNAVARNRIKRLCRECFRLSSALLPDKGIDLVVIAKPGAADLGLRDVQSEWSTAGPKLHAQCEKVLGAPLQ
jgi:ribonuclease P protein component